MTPNKPRYLDINVWVNGSSELNRQLVLRGGSAVGRWTCDLQVAGSIPGRWLSRNIGQLSLASLRGR